MYPMKKTSGFTLIESLVVLLLIGIIMGAIYTMILHFRDVSGAEQARVRQAEETRFIFTSFATEIRNAGSIMALGRTNNITTGLLDPTDQTRYMLFNGVYPLNNTSFPDGVILATGDPMCVNKLVQDFSPSGNTTLLIDLNPGLPPQWQAGDKGILLGEDGYYVFRVTQFDGSQTLTIGGTALYYSGLLDSSPYRDDAATLKSITGKNATYPANSLVVRLTNFSIYLMQQRLDPVKGRNIRELIRVTDTKEDPNPLANASTAEKSPITENIWDIQIVYSYYPSFPSIVGETRFYTNEFSPSSNDKAELLRMMDRKLIKEVTLNMVAMTDDYPGKGTVTYTVKAFADLAGGYTLPTGKFNFRQFAITVYPKNFGVGLL